MSWIREIEMDEADEALKAVYEKILKQRGKISNIIKVHSLNPGVMDNHMDQYMMLMYGRNGLKREERELIAVVVSKANECDYCMYHHGEALNHYWKDDERLEGFLKDPLSAELSGRSKALVEYVSKLTKTPGTMKQGDVQSLFDAGFSDDDVLNINLIAAHFNFTNRIALGLGVEFSDEEMQGYKY